MIVDDTGLVALTVPASWVDVTTAPQDLGDGGASPSMMASPDNEALVNGFDVSGVLVVVPTAPGTHEDLMRSFGLPEGCTSLVTEPFADGTLTGIIQRGEGCAGTSAVWRTIVGDTADGQTVMAQGQAPTPLALAELNATLASLVVTSPATSKTTPHPPAGTSAPLTTWTDTTSSISIRVPGSWTDVALDPFDFNRGTAAQPYVLASTDRTVFLESFDAPGFGVTIPNWEATHEELMTDFGLQAGCVTIEVVPFADDTLTGLLQRGVDCGGVGAEWRAIVGDTADGLTVVVVGQTSTAAGLSELEAAIGGISITAEFGGEDVVTDTTTTTTTSPPQRRWPRPRPSSRARRRSTRCSGRRRPDSSASSTTPARSRCWRRSRGPGSTPTSWTSTMASPASWPRRTSVCSRVTATSAERCSSGGVPVRPAGDGRRLPARRELS